MAGAATAARVSWAGASDGLPVTVHQADGREAPLLDAAFNRVLVDVPCIRPVGT